MAANLPGNLLGALGGANPLGGLGQLGGAGAGLNSRAMGGAEGFSKAMDFAWTKQDASKTLKAGIQTTQQEQQAKFMSLDGVGGSPTSNAIANISGAFKAQMQELQTINSNAEVAMQDYAAGKDIPLHQVMMKVNRAELSLQLATQVRNKMISAYQEISRMPI